MWLPFHSLWFMSPELLLRLLHVLAIHENGKIGDTKTTWRTPCASRAPVGVTSLECSLWRHAVSIIPYSDKVFLISHEKNQIKHCEWVLSWLSWTSNNSRKFYLFLVCFSLNVRVSTSSTEYFNPSNNGLFTETWNTARRNSNNLRVRAWFWRVKDSASRRSTRGKVLNVVHTPFLHHAIYIGENCEQLNKDAAILLSQAAKIEFSFGTLVFNPQCLFLIHSVCWRRSLTSFVFKLINFLLCICAFNVFYHTTVGR